MLTLWHLIIHLLRFRQKNIQNKAYTRGISGTQIPVLLFPQIFFFYMMSPVHLSSCLKMHVTHFTDMQEYLLLVWSHNKQKAIRAESFLYFLFFFPNGNFPPHHCFLCSLVKWLSLCTRHNIYCFMPIYKTFLGFFTFGLSQ